MNGCHNKNDGAILKENIMVDIVNYNSPASNEEIIAFEKETGVFFPEDYKSFLKAYNGGQPIPSAFSFLSKQEDGSAIDWFLSLGKDRYSNLREYYERYKVRLPEEMIPIAHDAGGNLVLIGVNEKQGIYFWDHEFEAEEGEVPDMSNVYTISQSFTDFLNNLHEIEL